MAVLRTDLAVVQVGTVPTFAGKNTVAIDPNFGTKILRFTDETDNPSSSLMTADSGNAGIWNKNDTLLLVRASSSASTLYQFNPKKYQRELTPVGTYKGKLCFSRAQANTLYQLLGSVVTKIVFKNTKGLWAEVSQTPVCDFAVCLPTGFKINWTGTFLVSMWDQCMAVAFSEGAQNSGFLGCVWKKGKKNGYRVLNTQTGEVTGSWGQVGQMHLDSPDTAVPFTLHAFGQTANPDYIMVGAKDEGASSSMIWYTPSLDVIDPGVSGHRAKGFEHFYSGGLGGGQLLEVSYEDLTETRKVVLPESLPANQTPPQKYTGDSHFGFGEINVDDDSIVWAAGQSETTPFEAAWVNEIRGYDVQAGNVRRACHTFNTGTEPEFIAANVMAVPSQTGRYVAFTSDIMGTLASKRADVFIVQVA